MSLLLRRSFSTSRTRPATPLYQLQALSHARETQHMLRSGLSITHHVPRVEAIAASEVAPFAPPRKGPGPLEAHARQEIANRVLRGDGRDLKTGAMPLPARRGEVAMAIVARSVEGDAVLGRDAMERVRSARGVDAVTPTTKEPMVQQAVTKEAMEDLKEEVEELREKKYQSFSAEEMQIGLLAAVVLLVVVNAYAFETLGAEREAREKLARRLGRLETWLAQERSVPVQTVGEAMHVPEAMEALENMIGHQHPPVGTERVAGWAKAFWAS